MHVLFVHQTADQRGGAERYVAETATLLRERGVRCTLLYGVPGWANPGYTRLFDGAFPMVTPRRQIEELGPDVVYVHQLADPFAVGPLRAAGAPVARFFHDYALFCLRDHKYTTIGQRTCTRTVGLGCYPCLGFVVRAPSGKGVRFRTVRGLRTQQRASAALDAFVVGSQYMGEHVAAHGFDRARIHVIPLFVRPPASELEPVERDPHLLLFVGALLRGKGLDVLLKALPQLPPPTRLEVVGTGRQEPWLRELASRLGLADRVTFTGWVSPDAVHERYRRAACLVVPSRRPETFGLVGPEAMLHGTPVVATLIGGAGEWLRDGETGLAVPSCEAAPLAAAIRRVIERPDEARAMGERGRALCAERFRPEQHVSALLTLFEQLARERHRVAPCANPGRP